MTFLLDALAVARLTRLVTKDAITAPVRDAIEARSVEVRASPQPVNAKALAAGSPVAPTVSVDVQPWAFLRDLVDCPWCSSVWLAAGVVIARKAAPRAWTPIGYGLALAALAGWLTSREDG